MATLTAEETKAEAKAKVMEAVEEAKRAVANVRRQQLEDLRVDAEYRIKKAPFMSVGIALGAGLFLGAIAGVIAGKAAKNKVSDCC